MLKKKLKSLAKNLGIFALAAVAGGIIFLMATAEPPTYAVFLPEMGDYAVCQKIEKSSCGISLSQCNDDVEYLCMQSIAYKRIK